MRHEAEKLLNAIGAYKKAHLGDSDDAEVDAAFEMVDASLALVRMLSSRDASIAGLVERFDKSDALAERKHWRTFA